MMKQRFSFFLLMILLVSCSKSTDSECTETPVNDCFCPYIYNPVCGCNDVVYGNACFAECLGITEYTEGECPYPFTGKWKVIQVYVDPGDGSGEFENVENGLEVLITDDGSVSVNGNLCSLNPEFGQATSATLDLQNRTITPDDCTDMKINVSRSFHLLILSHPCIEGCSMKLESIQ